MPDTDDTGEQKLRDELHEVQRHIDVLELASHEAKSPWYKQVPVLISFVALLISLYTVWAQSLQNKHEQIAQKLEALRTTVLQLEDLRNEWVRAQSESDKGTPQFVQRQTLLNTKKEVLVESADAIIADVSKYVSPTIFEVLAYEAESDSKFAEAKAYYNLALQSEYGTSSRLVQSGRTSWIDRVWPLWGSKSMETVQSVGFSKLFIEKDLAILYMQPNTGMSNLELGREKFREILQKLDKHDDEYARQTKTFIWLSWANAELMFGNIADGNTYLKRAENSAKAMSPWDTNRQILLQNIASAETLYGKENSGQALNPNGGEILGAWNLLYREDPAIRGTAYFFMNPETKSISATIGIMRDGKLIKKYFGPVYMPDATTVRVDWTGSVYPPSPLGPYVVGTTLLKLGTTTMTGAEYVVGDVTHTVRLAKHRSRE